MPAVIGYNNFGDVNLPNAYQPAVWLLLLLMAPTIY